MTSGYRHRRRLPPRAAASAAPPPSSAVSSSRIMGRRCCGGRAVAPLSSAILALTLVLIGYVTWKEVSSLSPGASLSEKAAPEGRPSGAHASSGYGTTPVYSIEVVKEYPHDPRAFTQGLLYAGNNTFFESTGLYGQSSVREVHIQTGKVQAIYHMESSFFGEGLTLLDERLFQVTWLTRTGFIYDRYNFNKHKKFTHQMQDGWGLATDGKIIFGSDGTSSLYQLDPQNLKVIKRAAVKYDGYEVSYLNELEYINGEIWANIWQSDCIARISSDKGEVLGWILLHKLRQQLMESGYNGIDVLNGIAWDKENDRLFVTGKLWPKVYEIKLQELRSHPLNGNIKELCQLRSH